MIFSSIIAPNFINAMSKHEHILAKKESFFAKPKKLRRQERINEAITQLLIQNKSAQFAAIGYQALISHLTTGGGVSGSLGWQKRSSWPWLMSAWVKLWTGPLTEICSRLSCFTNCRRPAPGSSFKMYITWWSPESVSVTFKCCSVMGATDPGREWDRLGHSPSLLLNRMSNDFRRLETKLTHTPWSKEVSAACPSVSSWINFNFHKWIVPTSQFANHPLSLDLSPFSLLIHFHSLPVLALCPWPFS